MLCNMLSQYRTTVFWNLTSKGSESTYIKINIFLLIYSVYRLQFEKISLFDSNPLSKSINGLHSTFYSTSVHY